MNHLENEIKNRFKEEIELPETVQKKVVDAYDKIQSIDVERKSPRKVKHGYIKVAVACISILLIGSSVYAAAGKYGIAKYFAKTPQEKVEKLIDKDVIQIQDNDNNMDSLVSFRVRQAICDIHQVVVEVEAKLNDPKSYLLVSGNSGLNAPVTDLGIDGITEGTVGEYAKSQGKKVLFVNVGLKQSSIANLNFKSESDETMLITIATDNENKKNVMNLTCLTSYYEGDNYNDAIRGEIAFQLQDKSSLKKYTYVANDNENLDKKYGWVFDKLEIKKTELSLGVIITSHNDEITRKKKERGLKKYDVNDYNLFYRVFTEDGRELELQKGEETLWNEDGTYQSNGIYHMIDLPDTLILKAEDAYQKVHYGTIRVHLKKK